MKKIKTLCKWSNLVTLILILGIGMLCICKAMGFEFYAIRSGSMAPTIKKGALAFVKKDAIEDITINNIVVFQNYEVSIDSFTHRIVGIDENKREFTTKGDANPSEDPYPTSFDTYHGRVYFSIPLLGYVRLLLNDYSILFIAFGMILIGSYIYESGGERDEKNNAQP